MNSNAIFISALLAQRGSEKKTKKNTTQYLKEQQTLVTLGNKKIRQHELKGAS